MNDILIVLVATPPIYFRTYIHHFYSVQSLQMLDPAFHGVTTSFPSRYQIKFPKSVGTHSHHPVFMDDHDLALKQPMVINLEIPQRLKNSPVDMISPSYPHLRFVVYH